MCIRAGSPLSTNNAPLWPMVMEFCVVASAVVPGDEYSGEGQGVPVRMPFFPTNDAPLVPMAMESSPLARAGSRQQTVALPFQYALGRPIAMDLAPLASASLPIATASWAVARAVVRGDGRSVECEGVPCAHVVLSPLYPSFPPFSTPSTHHWSPWRWRPRQSRGLCTVWNGKSMRQCGAWGGG
jgi:hypothetical protein